MLVPAAKAQAAIIGGFKPALARCRLLLRGRHTWRRGTQANASSGVAEEIRRAKKPRFGRHHMFASICNHYNRKSIE
jgi:hypothetical protein